MVRIYYHLDINILMWRPTFPIILSVFDLLYFILPFAWCETFFSSLGSLVRLWPPLIPYLLPWSRLSQPPELSLQSSLQQLHMLPTQHWGTSGGLDPSHLPSIRLLSPSPFFIPSFNSIINLLSPFFNELFGGLDPEDSGEQTNSCPWSFYF